jgi:hypothetical protein
VTPNTLQVLSYYNTSEGNLKPWLNRHPINPSEYLCRCSVVIKGNCSDTSSLFTDLVIGSNDHAAPNATGYMTSYALHPNTGELTYIDSVDTGGFPVPDYGVGAGG